MSDKFEITGDPARAFIRVTFRGHWDVGTVRDYKRALMNVVNAMLAQGCKRGDFIALVDIREGSVAQSQEVIALYKNELGQEDMTPRRLATLATSALFRRQIERIAMPNQRLFADEGEAMAWLLSDGETKQ